MDRPTRPDSAPRAWNLSAPDADHSTPIAVAQLLFALAMIGLGILGLIYGDFALGWQQIPIQHLPGRQFFAYACAVIELTTGVGLLMKRTTVVASRVLFIFLLLWVFLLKLPAVVLTPQIEASWLGFGEIAIILAGGWALFASRAGGWERNHLRLIVGTTGVRNARILFALSLPMVGLSHFFYSAPTVALVPAWLPYPLAWAYLTGAGNIAAGIGVLFTIYPRLAATMEASMLSIITLLVWAPGLATKPTDRLQWTAFLISSVITCGAWLVADSYRKVPWFTEVALAPSPASS